MKKKTSTLSHISALKWQAWFIFWNLLIAQFISLLYLGNPTSVPEGFWSWAFFLTAWQGHLAILALIIFILMSWMVLIPFRPHVRRWTFSIVALVPLVLLIIDAFVYNQYRFHLNSMVMDMFFMGGGQIISFTFLTWLKMIAIAVSLFLVEYYGVYRLTEGLYSKSKTRVYVGLSALYMTLFLSSNAIHATADAHHFTPVLRISRVLPLSEPLRHQQFFIKYGLIDVETYKKNSVSLSKKFKGVLQYPLEPLKCTGPKNLMNIVWIAIDATRFDMLTPEIMPNAAKLSEKSQVFAWHLSGSNETKHGIFSMFYGVPGSYFDQFQSTKQGPVLMREILNNNYDTGIFVSAPIDRPPFDQTVFVDVPNLRLRSSLPMSFERDREALARFQKQMDEMKSQKKPKPFFSFLFFDAPHEYSIPYDYPKLFQPMWESVDYLQLNNGFDPLPFLNRYKLSVHFVDSLIGQMIQTLEKNKFMKNTIVIITADHGQEFNETKLNYWGHNSNFSDMQVKVPMVVYWPGQKPAVYNHLTGHVDIAPTLMKHVLGCNDDPSLYSSGWDLFERRGHPWLYLGTTDNYGIYEPETLTTVKFSSPPWRTGHLLENKPGQVTPEVVQSVFNEMSRFLKAN